VGDPREDRVGDDCDEGGEAPCMAHLLDEDGNLDPPGAMVDHDLSPRANPLRADE
jgi:hypothetical protein